MLQQSDARVELAWRESLKMLSPEEEINREKTKDLPKKPPKKMPHYALPNTTAVLPDYHNTEQDVIQRAFAMANYDLIRDLPEDLRFTEVHRARREKMEEMKRALVAPNADGKVPSQIKATTYTGTFESFNYQPSSYDLPRQLASKEAAETREKMAAISGGVTFKPPGKPRKGKHEEPFKEEKEAAGYPYLGGLYEQSELDMLRSSWLEEGLIRHGPFVPSGVDRTMTRGQLPDFPARSRVREALGTLQGLLERDWEGVQCSVTYDDASEYIFVSIAEGTVESADALKSYMNVLLKSNTLLAPFHLARVASRWGTLEDGRLIFTLRPPWAAATVKEAFFALHPEHRSYAELQRSGFFEPSSSSFSAGPGRR